MLFPLYAILVAEGLCAPAVNNMDLINAKCGKKALKKTKLLISTHIPQCT